jgi:hypothetical protein
MATGNYPYGTTMGTQTSGMSPAMEAKFLWLMDQARDIAGKQYGDIPPQQVAGFTDEQKRAFELAESGIGAWEGYLGKFAERDFDPTDPTAQDKIAGYFDPYQKYLEQGLEEDYAKAEAQAGMKASSQGAFGGSGHGIINQELLRGKTMDLGKLRSGAYQTSLGLARGDFENQTQRYGQAAGMGQQFRQGDIASIMGAGSIKQQRDQQVLDADYQAMLTNRYDPMQRFGWMSDIFRGVPSGQMATTMGTSPQTNPLSQALGAGIFGAGVAQGWQNVG